jgi:NTE family protein
MEKGNGADCGLTVLVLQGGGALGAYQGGVYEALAASDCVPHWIAGTSIGAINAALIAGNAPEHRVERLKTFWDRVSSELLVDPPVADGMVRRFFNETAAAQVAATGTPGFFRPRLLPPALSLPGSPEAISLYDTAPLRATLLELVDFDRINHARGTRLSVGAVSVITGNLVYFDSRERTIGPEHIMASGALPPAFPPVTIDGEPYWDGGVVSNTPLQYVLDEAGQGDLTVFQVDLFSARGAMPISLADTQQREKDIRFSSRTRLNTDLNKRLQKLHGAAMRLAAKHPELANDPDLRTLLDGRHEGTIAIMHLINRSESFETQSKDYEFSRRTVSEHWAYGKGDTERSLEAKQWRERKPRPYAVVTYDLSGDLPRVVVD